MHTSEQQLPVAHRLVNRLQRPLVVTGSVENVGVVDEDSDGEAETDTDLDCDRPDEDGVDDRDGVLVSVIPKLRVWLGVVDAVWVAEGQKPNPSWQPGPQ